MNRTLLVATTLFATSAALGATEVWPYQLTSSGEDVFFTSPTAVDPAADLYNYTNTIELLEVRGLVFGFIDTGFIDVTNEIPPELLEVSGVIEGPAPVVITDQSFQFPDPPEPTSFAADVRLELDASGFGQLSLTNVVLGTVVADVPPFGMVEVELTDVRVTGTVEVTPENLPLPGDLDGNGVVNSADLLALLAAWGECEVPNNCPEDIDGNGVVDTADLLTLLANWT